MPVDRHAVERACPGLSVKDGRHFCRTELARFRDTAEQGGDLLVACTQETPIFNEIAEELANPPHLTFVNIRETAGWSKDAGRAAPKMAALIAAAAEPQPAIPIVSLTSDGVVLVYGRDAQAIETAHLLKDTLDVTVLIRDARDATPPRVTEFPVVQGKIRSAKGHLGAFELTIDSYAAPAASSRDRYAFDTPRDGAVSKCDLILDLSGGAPLFPAADLRDGYLRADPGDPAAVLRAVLKARDLVGVFDKPRYVDFAEDLCAHSRSRIVGCRRCLDLCPTGAITPNGDHVAFDAAICAGCGQCAAACPTGAAGYALPPADMLMRNLRTLLTIYRQAGGRDAVLLFHDQDHGAAMIDALARHGDGLPANVLPVAINEVTQAGLDAVAAAFAYGASAVRFLVRAKPRHDIAGLVRTIGLAAPVLAALGFDGERVATVETDDPFALGEALFAIDPLRAAERPATFVAQGRSREVTRLALRQLHGVAPAPVDVVMLPAGAPFGTIDVDVEGCTLCLSCVSACPTGALGDEPERPALRFNEDACVQCGLCKATCPEKVITLKPQLDFRAATAASRLIKAEEPYQCISCGKPFGTKSSVERVLAKLEGKHWMFKNSEKRLNVIKMCADCRVNAMVEDQFDPLAGPPRPKVRTTEDYLREREEAKARGEES
ncbi:MAG: 4Fe-4S binding protein [Xanthobacteraceae bacterium]|uniref:4Fe-4S binding protein n=1 Tax=Pseudolabrys sp. TaxID=1960880 RepID=UPI003D0C67D9